MGQEVFLGGTAYAIIGVYQPADGLLSRLSGDGRERVFVPYDTAPDTTMTLDTLYVQGNEPADGDTAPNPKPSAPLLTALNHALGGKLDEYERADYLQTQQLLAQGMRFYRFFMGLLAFVYVARLLTRTAVGAALWWYRTHKSVEPVRLWPLLQRLAVPALCVVALVMLVRLCSFPLYWPPEDVPEGKELLSLSFYGKLLLGFFQSFNAAAHTGPLNLRFYGGWAAGALGVAAVVAWARALANGWAVLREKLHI